MKRIYVFVICFVACTCFARRLTPVNTKIVKQVYANYEIKRQVPATFNFPDGCVEITRNTYTFELVKKLKNNAGIFKVWCNPFYVNEIEGNFFNTPYPEKELIIILNVKNLDKPGKKFNLKNNCKLYYVGCIKNPVNGKKYNVYATKPQQKIKNVF